MRTLKINSLPSVKEQSWCDRDYMMYHACFQLFVDFVEKEDGLNHANYEYYKETVDELRGLYDWWKSLEGSYNSDFEASDEAQEKLELLIKHRRFLWT